VIGLTVNPDLNYDPSKRVIGDASNCQFDLSELVIRQLWSSASAAVVVLVVVVVVEWRRT